MIYLFLILNGLFFTWVGWVLGRLRGDGGNGAGQSLNVSKGWDQFMLGLGLVVLTYPILGPTSLFLIPMQIGTWAIKWGAYRDLGSYEFNTYDDESEQFIRKFLMLIGFPYHSEGVLYRVRFWRDYLGWSIRALMISAIGLAPLFVEGWVMYLVLAFVFTMFMFRWIDKDWMKWFSWIPVGLLFAIPILGGGWIGFLGLLFPLQEWICQKMEEKGWIEGAWTWSESVHGATLFLGVYVWSLGILLNGGIR